MRRLALALAAVVVTGCGGGGGGGGTSGGGPIAPPTTAPSTAPGPTVAPSTVPSVAPTGIAAAAVTITSNPAGLAVTANGAPIGVTPVTTTPPFAAGSVAFAIGTGPNTYTVAVTQRGVPTTILYNQAGDTRGRIVAPSPSSWNRSVASIDPSSRRTLADRRDRPLFGRHIAVGYTDGTHALLDVAPDGDAAREAAAVRRRAGVAWAEPTHLRFPSAATVVPNDTHFDPYTQWSLFQTNMPTAWGYTTDASRAPIAVIDTGIDASQPDLAGKVTFGERVVNGVVSTGVSAASDSNGHGTLVAGIAAATTNNGAGFAGVGWNAPLQAYKIFADGATSADTADEARAVDDAVAHGAKVIVIALSASAAGGIDRLERDAIARATAAGVVVVAPAGNEHASALDFPAAYDGVLAVGASALDDSLRPGSAVGARERVASYSNSGPGLAVVAPGGDPTAAEQSAPSGSADLLHWIVNLGTTTPGQGATACATASDCYVLGYGTSLAAAHVAGGVALMLSKDATATPARIATILRATAKDLGDPAQGAGRVDFGRALAALTGDATAAAPSAANFVAFAYVPGTGNVPRILDVSAPRGVPVASDGTFRLADIPVDAGTYAIGVWYDANGDGVVDAGDWFASAGGCTPSAPCSAAASLTPALVPAGFVLR